MQVAVWVILFASVFPQRKTQHRRGEQEGEENKTENENDKEHRLQKATKKQFRFPHALQRMTSQRGMDKDTRQSSTVGNKETQRASNARKEELVATTTSDGREEEEMPKMQNDGRKHEDTTRR